MTADPHGISHIGIGVTDLDRSIAFYRDVLKFELVNRYRYQVPTDPSMSQDTARPGVTWWREVALVRVGAHDDDPVVVLSVHDTDNDPHGVEIDDVGTHHWGFWVTGIEDYVARLETAHVEFTMALRTFENARGWGQPSTVTMKSCIFRDPDGTMLQLDEKVPGLARP